MGKRSLLILGIALLIIAFLFLRAEHKERGGKENLEKAGGEMPLLEAEGINLMEWDDYGRKTWELQADSGKEFVKETVLNKARISFFQEGVLVSEGEAEKLIVNNQTSELLLQERVKIVSYLDGAELFTSNLKWLATEKKLYTKERVLFKRGNLIMEGRELIASPDLSQIVIKKEVTTRLIKIGGKI